MSYNILNNYGKSHLGLKLISLRQKDMYLIKDWRNQQMNILRQHRLLSDKDQVTYYNSVSLEFLIEKPKNILLSYLKDDHCIGYGGFVYISWEHKRAELSFLLNPEYLDKATYTELMEVFLFLIKDLAFNYLGFNRVYTETFDIRKLHIEILEKNGFQLEGCMKEHLLIENKFIDSLIHGCTLKSYVIK